MKTQLVRLSVVAALVVAVGVAPALARSGADAVALERQLARGDHRGFVSIIELNYYLLTEYAKNAGSDLRFRLSEFKTYRPDEYGTMVYGDLATVTGGWTIDVVRHTRTDQRQARRSIEFAPTWKEAGHAAALHDVLADITSDRPEMAGQLQAVTTYQVRAEMSDRVREYRAAFLWSADEGPGGAWTNLRLLPLDGIVRGLDHALSSPLPPQGRRIEPVLFRRSPTKSYCSAGQTTEQPPGQSRSGSDRHVTGEHYGEFGTDFRCTCSESCTSTCEPFASYTECSDTGTTGGGFHVTDLAYDDSVTVVQAATTAGAKCASAFICGVKQCTFPSCAFSVSVSVQGQTASFTSAGAFWSFTATFEGSCAPCQEFNQPPPPPPDVQDPYGSGGGGGSSGSPGQTCTLVCSGGSFVPWACEFRCW
jgi:hypothetical protein